MGPFTLFAPNNDKNGTWDNAMFININKGLLQIWQNQNTWHWMREMHVFEVIHNRGSTNMDLSRDDEGATQDRSNAPITTPHDPEQVKVVLKSLLKVLNPPSQVSETKCCCFFKRKMRKKKSSRTKWPPGTYQAIFGWKRSKWSEWTHSWFVKFRFW